MPRAAFRSSPAPAAIRRRKRSRSRALRSARALRRACRSCRITTSRRRKACTGISARSPKRVDLPLILYNVPSRTVADLANDTLLRLAEVPGIVGLKDATSDLVRLVDLRNRLPAGREFALYSGNDDTALAFMLLGGNGVVSVTANVAPQAGVGGVRCGAGAATWPTARRSERAARQPACAAVRRSEPDPGQVGACRDGFDPQ